MKKKATKRQTRRPPDTRTKALDEKIESVADQLVPEEILAGLPKEIQVAYTQSISFKGPLPPPVLLEEYEKIDSGLADRIVKMAESEMSHRQQWEMKVLIAQKTDIQRGSWLGFMIAVGSLSVAGLCAYLGEPLVAVAALFPPIGGVMWAVPRIVRSLLNSNE
ncbi:MAG: DUF2335 domain-containing protein [Rhodobacteraceae bacterium]|nr:DUF2335 domain-containing protein [Paracoccaceae bacterium]